MCVSVRMSAVNTDDEDELIDLNKEPVERIPKNVTENISNRRGRDRTDGIPKPGRVLRSRTVAIGDGEKQVTKMEIANAEDKHAKEPSGVQDKNEGEISDLQKKTKVKGRRGRPPKNETPKVESTSEASPLSHTKKRKRGRPPKVESTSEISSINAPMKRKRGRPLKGEGKVSVSDILSCEEMNVSQKESKMPNKIGNDTCKDRVKPKLRKRGRPPKILNGSVELFTKKDDVNINSDHQEFQNGEPVKRLKVGRNDLECDSTTTEFKRSKSAEVKEKGSRQQKQLLRERIIAMLKSAGWSVEYRQRQSKDYQDAVYVDREGRTYWSVTLAYKKFKASIDKGNADVKDISAFDPIPEETLRILFRVSEKGRRKKSTEDLSGSKISLDGKTKPRVNRGKRRTLLARRPNDGSNSDGYELYEGKRSLLTWMIDLGTVPIGQKVVYRRGKGKRILLEGTITKEGISCDCCNIMHTIRGFEFHAGSTLGRPYQNIYLDSGNSLSQFLVDSWKKHIQTDDIGCAYVDVNGDDPNDDTCNICGDGGDLICCDSCPSTFHHGCLHINVPSGDWHCVYCSCKFCGMACEDSSSGNCSMLACHLCEEKFHVDCAKEMISEKGKMSFCGKTCFKIFQQLQALLGFRNELEEGFSYTVLQFRNFSGDASLDGDISTLESNAKLALASTVMDECFRPIIDERSGASVIHNVVYSCGSNIRRLNYDRFVTVILEKGDELVSAASIRIHGSPLAEMPFIGTRYTYRRQGMCNRLLGAIEKVLSSLGIEKLVIPAVSELNETWTKVFGFVPIEESKRVEMMFMNMIAFPGVDMLEKTIIQKDQHMDSAADGRDIAGEDEGAPENVASSEKGCGKCEESGKDAENGGCIVQNSESPPEVEKYDSMEASGSNLSFHSVEEQIDDEVESMIHEDAGKDNVNDAPVACAVKHGTTHLTAPRITTTFV